MSPASPIRRKTLLALPYIGILVAALAAVLSARGHGAWQIRTAYFLLSAIGCSVPAAAMLVALAFAVKGKGRWVLYGWSLLAWSFSCFVCFSVFDGKREFMEEVDIAIAALITTFGSFVLALIFIAYWGIVGFPGGEEGNRPNKFPDPTPAGVTPGAGAPVAPPTSAGHS